MIQHNLLESFTNTLHVDMKRSLIRNTRHNKVSQVVSIEKLVKVTENLIRPIPHLAHTMFCIIFKANYWNNATVRAVVSYKNPCLHANESALLVFESPLPHYILALFTRETSIHKRLSCNIEVWHVYFYFTSLTYILPTLKGISLGQI